MKALLMHRDRDFDAEQELPRHAPILMQDLELSTLLGAMAADDKLVSDVARKVLLTGLGNDLDTILYRQDVLKDSLKNPAAVRELYGLAVEALEGERKHHLGIFSRYPSGLLYDANELLQVLMGVLRKLRGVADAHAGRFASEAFKALFAMLETELSDAYFGRVEEHLSSSFAL